MSIIKRALEFIKELEFVDLATADKTGKPNSAPKFFLKTNGKIIYLIDYSIGRSVENIKVNPRVSLSFIDFSSLFGYRLSGKAKIIEAGKFHDKCLKEFEKKGVKFSAKRIIKEVDEGKSYKAYEIQMTGRILVYKITIEEVSEISPSGEIMRENKLEQKIS